MNKQTTYRDPIVSFDNLTIHTNKKGLPNRELVHSISTSFAKNKITGVVGESGSGKSISMKSIMGMLPEGLESHFDQYRFDGDAVQSKNLLDLPISMIFQDSNVSLNPLRKVNYHLLEVIERFHHLTGDKAEQRMLEELRSVGIKDAERVAKQYPFELSGGMRQRVMICMALLKQPKLLIADEPTTALDVTIQKQILDLIVRKKQSEDLSVIFVTHDLGVVAEICDEVKVMYDGVIVEEGSLEDVFYRPVHRYTRELIKAIPRGVNGERLYTMERQILSESEKQGILVNVSDDNLETPHRVLKGVDETA